MHRYHACPSIHVIILKLEIKIKSRNSFLTFITQCLNIIANNHLKSKLESIKGKNISTWIRNRLSEQLLKSSRSHFGNLTIKNFFLFESYRGSWIYFIYLNSILSILKIQFGLKSSPFSTRRQMGKVRP